MIVVEILPEKQRMAKSADGNPVTARPPRPARGVAAPDGGAGSGGACILRALEAGEMAGVWQFFVAGRCEVLGGMHLARL